ncbi:MAG: protein phosphatase 2C domain-containing protein [Gemmataceae bacterium]|nr:protein phosphatase 2C domain-containing protein [Gemmataceae bacterium]MCI0742959.1 protein phosphatase 2C domain-containing protein [Gemmataceae bacterium]
MSDFVLRVGSRSAQGIRPNNEDRFVVDLTQNLFLVADGMGGQDRGELASGMAAEIIPQVLHERMAAQDSPEQALRQAMAQANQAILDAGQEQPEGRRMGTTAVVAVHRDNQVFVAGLGDSRAYLIREGKVEQLTVDHSVAQALVASGALTPEEARHSPYQHVLHKFLGCSNMGDGADVSPFEPKAGDCLLLGSDGLTNHLNDEDMLDGRARFPDPQDWADHLVQLALSRGSRDNVTCVVVTFEQS